MCGVRPPAGLSDGEARQLLAPLRRDRGCETVLIALSGGPDSTALAGLAARVAAQTSLARLFCATVDHGLRPESADEAVAAGNFARSLGLPHEILGWTGPKPTRPSQAAARTARYRLLAECAFRHGARHIITAHTLDDQAETVLLRLVAGSGPGGLGAMAEEAMLAGCTILRPLLDVPKARLVETCGERGWPYVIDPSNGSDRFARVRMRQAMPLLAAEGLTTRRLATLARRLRRADGALENLAAGRLAAARRAPGSYDAAVLIGNPSELALRALVLALWDAAPAPVATRLRLERLERLADELAAALREGQSLRRTLGGFCVTLAEDMLEIGPEPARRRGKLRQTRGIRAAELGNTGLPP